ncbi:conserved Plasmodium protein, unknown function [Plasmodium malariae]|uniref:RING-type domain-containing protein n=1 Tax=Plasmodium malariae TaxID=5858 RepID=A0A1C3L0B5_PLAMA|nr:conserved Plasmodium protein, unknown function [Plasmodium malariae]
MEQGENFRKKNSNYSDLKLEKFKREAFEIIEYKDKIIRMLCAILEVQGTTTLNIKEFITSTTDQTKGHLFENSEYEDNSEKSDTKILTFLINVPGFKALNKNSELNLFSTPNKIDEELNKERNFSDSVLSSYKLSLNEKHSENKIITRDISVKKNIQEDMVPSEVEQDTSSKNSVPRKKALENFRNRETNFECTYKSNSQKEHKSSKTSPKICASSTEECQLCLMPNTESLHGNFPPTFYKLSCDHVFHLMCVYETVIRRECRKTCCICHNELSEEDRNNIISKVKREKKENEKKSKILFKVMKLQADNND